MKTAIPIWENRVSPVFDTAQKVLLCDIREGVVSGRREEGLASGFPKRRVSQLAEMGVNVLICGAISRSLANMVAAAEIQVIPFVAGDVDDVIRAFVDGRLAGPAFLMPGCCGRRRRLRGGRRGGQCWE